MASGRHGPEADDLIDVRQAAALAERHPETVRRWVWSGRLAARRQGNRLVMARADVEAMAGRSRAVIGLTEWADRARAARQTRRAKGSGRSAAGLVIDDRTNRSRDVNTHAGR